MQLPARGPRAVAKYPRAIMSLTRELPPEHDHRAGGSCTQTERENGASVQSSGPTLFRKTFSDRRRARPLRLTTCPSILNGLPDRRCARTHSGLSPSFRLLDLALSKDLASAEFEVVILIPGE